MIGYVTTYAIFVFLLHISVTDDTNIAIFLPVVGLDALQAFSFYCHFRDKQQCENSNYVMCAYFFSLLLSEM